MKVVDFIVIWVEIHGGRIIEKACHAGSEEVEFVLDPLMMKHKGVTVMPCRLALMPVYEGGA